MTNTAVLMRIARWFSIALLVTAVGVQFKRPNRTNPPVAEAYTLEANVTVPSEVAAIFERACNDCHSNKTRWPWYSEVAPVSWFVTDHVTHGRKHLNFSEWTHPTPHSEAKTPDEQLERIRKQVSSGHMPISSYTLIHRDAVLTSDDIRTICEWAAAAQQKTESHSAAR